MMSEEIIYSRTDQSKTHSNIDQQSAEAEHGESTVYLTFVDISPNAIHRRPIADNTEASALLSALLTSDNITNGECELFRQWVIIYESIVTYLPPRLLCMFMTGSSIECSFSSDSDYDQMREIKDTEVTSTNDCDVSKSGNVLIMSQENTPPGFAFLYVYKLSEDPSNVDTISFLESCMQTEGGLCLSSEKYIEYYRNLISGRNKNSPSFFHAGESRRHGPCVKLNYFYYGKDSEISIGFKCFSWPEESLEWISRKRNSNWPDEDLINKIRKMPCHVFPVGFPQSKTCDLEWRFAFILPERELVWSFCDVRIHCYVILKTLKKEMLDKIADNEINSFHLKTVVFWKSEEINDWNGLSLIDNVKKCLIFLKECVQQRHLSHYFLKSRNLFAGKLQEEDVRDNLSREIVRIQANVLDSFLNCKWRYQYGNLSLLRLRLSLLEQPETDFTEAVKEVLLKQSLPVASNRKFLRNPSTHARTFSMMATIQIIFYEINVRTLQEIVRELTDKLKETTMGYFAVKFLYIRIGMFYLAEAKRTEDKDKRGKLISNAKIEFEHGKDHDVLAAPMYMLTYWYQVENYKVMNNIFEQILKSRFAISYEGTPGYVKCGKRSFLSPNMDETVTEEDMLNYNDVAFDVIFSSSDISCVPPALQYECSLLGGSGRFNYCFCTVNPLVYICYVQFEVAVKRRNGDQQLTALDHLRKMVHYVESGGVETDGQPIELHRHYNILGYCYYVMRDVYNAYKWFQKSLKACPNIGNAAAYHMGIIIVDSIFSQG